MSIEKIANDLAKKSYISRNLGGVIKAGQYAAWAEEYREIAQEHYDSLKAEKKAEIDPLVLSTLIGGGIGAGTGALGSLASNLISGKKSKNKLKDALTYGLMGGLGGAGLGAAKQLWVDRNALDKAMTWAQGLPPKEYPSEELAEVAKQIGDTGIHNATLPGAAANAAIQGSAGAAGGATVGSIVDKYLPRKSFRITGVDPKEVLENLDKMKSTVERSSHSNPLGQTYSGKSYVQEARPNKITGKIESLFEDPIKTEMRGSQPNASFHENTPWVEEVRVKPGVPVNEIFGFDKGAPLDLNKIKPDSLIYRMTKGDPKQMEALIRNITGPEGKSFLENLAKVEVPKPTILDRLLGYNKKVRLPKIEVPAEMKPTVGRGTRVGGALGALAGLGSAGLETLNASKSRAEIGGILANNISKVLNSPEVANNPEYVKILSGLAQEASKGVSLDRGNEIMNTLNNMFVQ